MHYIAWRVVLAPLDKGNPVVRRVRKAYGPLIWEAARLPKAVDRERPTLNSTG
jgi:hypothetical protein